MIKTAKNKLLLLLTLLLILTTGTFLYWYMFIHRCEILPNEYLFLEPFLVENKCNEKEFLINGYIYNSDLNGEFFTFDLDAWNENQRLSTYKKDTSLDLSSYKSKDLELSGIHDLNVVLKIKVKRNGDIESWSLNPIQITNDEYTKIIQEVYWNSVTFNKNEDVKFGPITTEVFEGEDEDGNSVTLHHNDDSIYDLTLYRIWIESFLIKSLKEEKINGLSTVLKSSDLNETTKSFLSERTNIINKKIELSKLAELEGESCSFVDEELMIEKKTYLQNNSLGCNLVEEIYQNSSNNEIKELLLPEFCNLDNIIQDIENLTSSHTERYTDTDLLQSISQDRIVQKTNYTIIDNALPLENHINFIPDSFLIQNYYPELINMQALNTIKSSMINEVLYEDNWGIKDICNLAYSARISSEYSDDEFYVNLLNSVKLTLLEDTTYTLKLLDESSYASFLCFEAYKEEEDLKELLFSRVWKSIFLNIYNNSNKKGLWENDNYYNIRTNARFLKILLENNEYFY